MADHQSQCSVEPNLAAFPFTILPPKDPGVTWEELLRQPEPRPWTDSRAPLVHMWRRLW